MVSAIRKSEEQIFVNQVEKVFTNLDNNIRGSTQNKMKYQEEKKYNIRNGWDNLN